MLVYSFVCKEGKILAEYSPYTGNFHHVALDCLTKLVKKERKFTITCEAHTFNFLNDNGYFYLAVAKEAYGRTVPFAFLSRVRDEFSKTYANTDVDYPSHSLDEEFGPRLKFHMEYVMANPEEISKVAALHKQASPLKQTMQDNGTKVLERNEKHDILEVKPYPSQDQLDFKEGAKKLHAQLWYQTFCFRIMLVFVLFILLTSIVVASLCYSVIGCI